MDFNLYKNIFIGSIAAGRRRIWEGGWVSYRSRYLVLNCTPTRAISNGGDPAAQTADINRKRYFG
jgi:hypothetical protein